MIVPTIPSANITEMLKIVEEHCSYGTVSGGDQLFAALAVRIRIAGRGNRDAQTVVLASPDAGTTWRVVPYDLAFISQCLHGFSGIWPPETPLALTYAESLALEFRDYTSPIDYSPFRDHRWLAQFKLRSKKWSLRKVEPLQDKREDWLDPPSLVWLELDELMKLFQQLSIDPTKTPELARWLSTVPSKASTRKSSENAPKMDGE